MKREPSSATERATRGVGARRSSVRSFWPKIMSRRLGAAAHGHALALTASAAAVTATTPGATFQPNIAPQMPREWGVFTAWRRRLDAALDLASCGAAQSYPGSNTGDGSMTDTQERGGGNARKGGQDGPVTIKKYA